jgi:Polyketide cyclase / dehydrase and lipid transport
MPNEPMITMSKRVLVVSTSAHIARPIDVVRRHFSDVDHHTRYSVHPDVVFTPLADSGDERRFRKTIRILGIPVVDEVVLRRQADGSITEDSVGGPSTGMRLVSRFRADGPELTATTLTVEIPVGGLKRLAAPLLRRFILRRLTKALDEDRHDLEGGWYPS